MWLSILYSYIYTKSYVDRVHDCLASIFHYIPGKDNTEIVVLDL